MLFYTGEDFTGIGLPENDIFYFHPDHLGSTSYITTRNGSISQHVEYIAFGEVLFEEHSSSFSSPYLFNGKELDRETNLSYFGARYYDAKTSVWLNVDPVTDHPNQIDKSAYSAFWGNPITYTDPDGRCPKCEDEIYLELANHAYEAKRGDISPNGWQAIRVDENKKTGYKGVLYQGFNETNEKQYIYATQGTNPGSGDDWENNIQQAVMGNSPQYKQSVEIAKDLASNYEGISFTGHSLGGGLASANALATNGKAVTFNAAGLSKKTKTNLGLDGKKANISAYVVQGEIVSHLQGKIGLRAEGRITTLPATYIMQIPYLKTDDQIRTAQRISNHLMGPVMEKFKELKR